MELNQALEKLLHSFERYYSIKTEDVLAPFSVTAEFHSHGEQYVLLKVAKISDVDSNDYVYFKTDSNLTTENLKTYCQTAWEDGISKVRPNSGHKNSDVTVVILADKIDDDTKAYIKKVKYYKSYKFSFYGWSHFRLIAKELDSGKIFYNRFGSDLKKVLANI